jgi:hypothetical protein
MASEFELLSDAYTADLAAIAGSPDAVEIAGQKYPAIVGRLRAEVAVESSRREDREEVRESCQLSIRCPADEVWLDRQVLVRKYTTADASQAHSQVFYVRSIDSAADGLVTVQVWRERLVSIQRRGFEGATR